MLEKISQWGSWSYLFLFVMCILESSVFFGLVFPVETAVVLFGFLAAQHVLKLSYCIAVVIVGVVIGDNLGYKIGSVSGRRVFMRWKKIQTLVVKVESYFFAHGKKTVLIGRFFKVLRTCVPFVAGMLKMPWRHFFIFNLIGDIAWATTFCLVGFFFGDNWELIEKWMNKAGLLIGVIVVLAGVGFFIYKKRKTAPVL